MKKLLQSKRQGSTVPLAVVSIIMLLAMGVGLLSLGFNSRILSIRNSSDIAARCAADTGLTIALFEMNEILKAKLWNNGNLPQATNVSLPYCDAVYSYKVTGDHLSGYVITSVGKSGQAQRTVSATTVLKGLFDDAVFTKADLILKAGTLIDGYNSLDKLDKSTNADIATQSTADSSIILNSGVVVNGDVRVGLGGNPDTAIKDLGAEIAGFKYGATANDPSPQITAPDDLSDMGTKIYAKATTVTITPEDNGTYTGIQLQQGSENGVLVVDEGDVVLHITGDVELGQGCEIIVKDGSSLTLYADSDIHCRESSGITVESPTKEAEVLKLYATGENAQYFDIKANSEWVGVVYAPNADVTLYANGDAYGSITAHNFEFKSGGHYHYDRALKNVSVEDEGIRLVVDRWSEGKF
jgi:hypothetical protein